MRKGRMEGNHKENIAMYACKWAVKVYLSCYAISLNTENDLTCWNILFYEKFEKNEYYFTEEINSTVGRKMA